MALLPRGTYDPSYANDPSEQPQFAPPPEMPVAAPTAPQMPNRVGINENTGEMFVNGKTFNVDDHQSALESEEALRGPAQALPSNYRPISAEEFGGYISNIRNPSLGTLAKKNFGIGVDVSQQLAGSALKFFGAEETGQAIVDQQTEDLRYNQPYQRAATDIDSAGGAGEWFVANAAQMAPLMAEMIITSALTGGVGGVAATTARGAGFLAKGAAKQAAKRVGPTIKQSEAISAKRAVDAMRNNIKPEAADLAVLRKAGRIGGAKLGAVAAAEGVAIGDIYQAVEESGNYDSPTLARLVTAVASPFYAAAEIAPAALALKVAGKALRSGGRAGRFGKGFVQGAGLEGGAEVAQDMLSLGAAGKLDLQDPEVINQLINAFAAGAGIGAPIGGVANSLARNEATDILNKDKNEEEAEAEQEAEVEEEPGEQPIGQPASDPEPADPLTPEPLPNEEFEFGDEPGEQPLDGYEAEQTPQDVLDLTEADALPTETGGTVGVDPMVSPAAPAAPAAYPALPEAIPGVDAERAARDALKYGAAQIELPTGEEVLAEDRVRALDEAQYNDELDTQYDQAAAAVPFEPAFEPKLGYPTGAQQEMDLGQEVFPDQLFPAPTNEFGSTSPYAQNFSSDLNLFDGEPTINVSRLDPSTGERVMAPVSVRQALEDNTQRMDALQALRTCLRGK